MNKGKMSYYSIDLKSIQENSDIDEAENNKGNNPYYISIRCLVLTKVLNKIYLKYLFNIIKSQSLKVRLRCNHIY